MSACLLSVIVKILGSPCVIVCVSQLFFALYDNKASFCEKLENLSHFQVVKEFEAYFTGSLLRLQSYFCKRWVSWDA